MRLISLKFTICLISLFLTYGISCDAQKRALPKQENSTLSSDSLVTSDTINKTSRDRSFVDPIYKVNIRETKSDNGFFSRLFLPGYKNQNFRALIISYQKYFPSPFNEYYILVAEKAFHFPIIFFFLAIIIALIGNVVVVIGILLITNFVMNYREKEAKKLREFFENVITNMLLRVTTTEETIKILSQPYIDENKNLLIDVLMDFQKSFRGDSDRQIIELYQKMDLGRISYNKTFAISFYEQVKGIRELANLHPFHATEMLTTRLNDPNDIVRAEAQICYPHVNKEAPFNFLTVLEKPFSHWAQLNIYYFIKIHEMPVPSFDRWIYSRHSNVVHFCIRMIDLFQQQEQSSHLVKLLKNRDEVTRNLAIIACGNLHLFESKEVLKNIFAKESLKNQLEIIKAFRSFGEEVDFSFLDNILSSENIALRLEACRTLFNLGESGKLHLEKLQLSTNFALEPYIAHVKDLRN